MFKDIVSYLSEGYSPKHLPSLAIELSNKWIGLNLFKNKKKKKYPWCLTRQQTRE